LKFGYKSNFGGRGILNAAVFYNQIDDMQREVNLPGPIGVIQLVRNTAEATIMGWRDRHDLGHDGQAGWPSPPWVCWTPAMTRCWFDLNGDGVIDGARQGSGPATCCPVDLTWTVGLSHDMDLGSWGYMGSRVSYSYRDKSAYTDNNLGMINRQERVDAGLDFYSNDGHWVFSIYGRNLLNKVLHGNHTQLPDTLSGVPLGGTFAPLSKGRRIGLEVTYNL
jgi:iron complex outermembrane recepter protein